MAGKLGRVNNFCCLLWGFVATMLVAVASAAPQASQAGAGAGLTSPVRIAAMPGERLLVSDAAAGAVYVLDRGDFKVLRAIPVNGRPVAVAWGGGRIYVGNETLGRVEAYNLAGQLMTTFGSVGAIPLPNAISVDAAGERLMVLDARAKSVKIFALDGTYLYDLTRPGALVQPSAMRFDPLRSLVMVSDYGPSSSSLFRKPQAMIHLFDLAGNEVRRFTGSFVRPQGLDVSGDNRVYVVDCVNSTIQVLDGESGARLAVLGGLGSDPGMLDHPLDLIVDESGILYVTDYRNGRIATFDAGGVTP